MRDGEWAQVSLVVQRALELNDDERDAYLRSIYLERPALQPEVDSLLAAERQHAAESTGWTIPGRDSAETTATFLGRRFGPYRLTGELGSGGMGIVYRARREDGQFDKDVAIKVLHWGVHSATLTRLFGQERRMLAALDHPGITRLLDSGVTQEGLPYIVMEIVEGVTITEHCARAGMPIRARVALMARVCEAVHYAHQNLVIHRDLKPGNIFVRSDGQPKLLDFGVAKWLEEATHSAGGGLTAAPFTPKYASPEQLTGRPVTTATDIYSLGKVLAELVEEVSPAGGEQRRDADLSAIVRKATRAEAEDRYSSAAEMRGDLEAYAGGRAVSARKWSWPLASWKWVKRNKRSAALIAANTLIVVALLWRYQAESARAIRRGEDVRHLAGAITSEVSEIIGDLPKNTTARAKLARVSLQYLDKLASDNSDPTFVSELAAAYSRLADVVGNSTIGSLGDLPKSRDLHRRALEMIERSHRAAPDNLLIRQRYAQVLLTQSDIQSGEKAKQIVMQCERLLDSIRGKVPETDEYLLLEGKFYEHRDWVIHGWGQAAGIPYREKARIAFDRLCKRNPDNMNYRVMLAGAVEASGRLEPGLERRIDFTRQGVAMRRMAVDRDPRNPWFRLSLYLGEAGIASEYRLAGRLAPALPYVRSAIEHLRRAADLDPSDASVRGYLAFGLADLGSLESALGHREEAEKAAREGIALGETMLATDPTLFRPNWGMGHAYRTLGDLGIGDRCANFTKALTHARTANKTSGGRNPSVRSLIGELERLSSRCPAQ